MQVATQFLRLTKPAALGNRINGWRVCWVGGWDRCRVLFVVMVESKRAAGAVKSKQRAEAAPAPNRRGVVTNNGSSRTSITNCP
jgi:hypothetical protein